MLRLLVARSGVAGGGRRVAWDGAIEARAAQARSLALQRCVQGAGAWAGCGAEDLATHCDADLSGGPGPRGVAYSTRYYS